MKYTEVQSSRRWLWASVSLSHPAFASPAARLCVSVTANISSSWLLRVSELDKKLKKLAGIFLTGCDRKSHLILSSSGLFLAPSRWSLRPPCLSVSSWGQACGDGAGEWMRGWWGDKQETLVSNCYDSCGVLPERGLTPPSHSSALLATMGVALVTLRSVCEEERPSGASWG